MKQEKKGAWLRHSAVCAVAAVLMAGMVLTSCSQQKMALLLTILETSDEASASVVSAESNANSEKPLPSTSGSEAAASSESAASASISSETSSSTSEDADSSMAASSESVASSASSTVTLTEEEIQAVKLSAYRAEILELVNQKRYEKGQAFASMDDESLNAAVQEIAEEYANLGKKPKAAKYVAILNKYDVFYVDLALNFTKGPYETPKDIMNYWLEEKSGEIYVGAYTKLGVGYAEKENEDEDGTTTYYWVLLFIKETEEEE